MNDPESNTAKKYPEIDEERQLHQPKGVYLLHIKRFINEVDPDNYYLTSGEAIDKIEAMIRDMQKQLKAAKDLHHQLIALRGRNKYLETEASIEGTILRIKNPRSAKAKLRKIRTDIPNLVGIVSYGDKLFSRPSKKEGVVTYCAINPDLKCFAYFNSYNNKVTKNNVKFKQLKQDIENFENKLRSSGYRKVLL